MGPLHKDLGTDLRSSGPDPKDFRTDLKSSGTVLKHFRSDPRSLEPVPKDLQEPAAIPGSSFTKLLPNALDGVQAPGGTRPSEARTAASTAEIAVS